MCRDKLLKALKSLVFVKALDGKVFNALDSLVFVKALND